MDTDREKKELNESKNEESIFDLFKGILGQALIHLVIAVAIFVIGRFVFWWLGFALFLVYSLYLGFGAVLTGLGLLLGGIGGFAAFSRIIKRGASPKHFDTIITSFGNISGAILLLVFTIFYLMSLIALLVMFFIFEFTPI